MSLNLFVVRGMRKSSSRAFLIQMHLNGAHLVHNIVHPITTACTPNMILILVMI